VSSRAEPRSWRRRCGVCLWANGGAVALERAGVDAGEQPRVQSEWQHQHRPLVLTVHSGRCSAGQACEAIDHGGRYNRPARQQRYARSLTLTHAPSRRLWCGVVWSGGERRHLHAMTLPCRGWNAKCAEVAPIRSRGTASPLRPQSCNRRGCFSRLFGTRALLIELRCCKPVLESTIYKILACCVTFCCIFKDAPSTRRVASPSARTLRPGSMAIRLTGWLEETFATQLLLGHSWLHEKNKLPRTGATSGQVCAWRGLYHDNGSCLDIINEVHQERNSFLQIIQARDITTI
jgi:hypothetical protein